MDESMEDTKPEATPAEPIGPAAIEPQRHSNPGLWLLLGALGLAGGGLFLWQFLQPQREATTAAEAAPATAVTTETLQLSSVAISSEFVGFLEAKGRVTLRPEVAGQVVRIFVEDGDRVAIGAPVIQLNPRRPTAVVNEAQAASKSCGALKFLSPPQADGALRNFPFGTHSRFS